MKIIRRFDHMKKRLGIKNNLSLIVILFVFAITGSAAVYMSKLVTPFINKYSSLHQISKLSIRVVTLFIAYQILLIIFGAMFGQFHFFWNQEKRMLMRIKRLFISKKNR